MKRKQGSSSGKLSMASGKRRRSSSSASASSSTSQNITTTDTAMDALPDELLITIFQLLPLCDLARVERVCKTWRELVQAHGWRSVHHFDDDVLRGKDYLKKRAQLLTLIGPHLKSADLSFVESANQRSFEEALGMCPNLAHLSLYWGRYSLISSALEHMGSDYSTQLRTLSLKGSECDFKEAALFPFDKLVSLEYLHLKESWRLIGNLQFPPSMTSLRKLSLQTPVGKGGYYEKSPPLLDAANIAMLASLPQLRSLTLGCNISFVSYSFLRAFPHLEHLCVEATLSESHDSLTADALPHMRALKAIEVRYYYSTHEIGTRNPAEILAGLFAAAAAAQGTTNQQLEHIGVLFSKRSNHKYSTSYPENFELSDLPTSVAERLVSLEVEWPGGKWTQQEAWCRRLPEMPRMEHLSIASWSPSLADVCTIMEKCKKLRYLDVGNFELSTDVCRALAASANLQSQKEEKMTEGERQGDPVSAGLLLRIQAADEDDDCSYFSQICRKNEERKKAALSLPRGGAEYGCSRLRFTRDAASSHVLNRYAYGCLSEKLPPSFMQQP